MTDMDVGGEVTSTAENYVESSTTGEEIEAKDDRWDDDDDDEDQESAGHRDADKDTKAGASAKDDTEDDREETTEDTKPKTRTIKVNGKDVEVTEDEAFQNYQKYQAADERFREAANLAKEAKEQRKLVDSFLENPWEFLKSQGKDPYQLAENLLIDKLKYEQLSPEQKHALETENKLKRLETERDQERQAREKERQEFFRQKAAKELDLEIGGALKEFGKKPTPRLVARVAETMLAHLERQGGKKLPAKDALRLVEREYHNDIAEYLQNIPIETAKQVLPKKFLDALRKANIEEVKSQDPMRSRQRQTQSSQTRSRGRSQRLSTDEFFAKLDKKFGS